MDEFAQWAEHWKVLVGGGAGGTVVGLVWGGIAVWSKWRKVAREDNTTTAQEWRTMAKEAWSRQASMEKRMDSLRDKHHQDMAVVIGELKACNDDRTSLHAQNSRQQEQLDSQKNEINELKDHVSKLSSSIRR